MNKTILTGRLTKAPELRYSTGENPVAVCNYTLAVDRYGNGTDFIDCVCFGKDAEFVNSYFVKGKKVAVLGRIQTGTYTNSKGEKVRSFKVLTSEHEFADGKNTNTYSRPAENTKSQNLPDGFSYAEDESDLPF